MVSIETPDWQLWGTPVFFVLGAIITGFIVEKVLIATTTKVMEFETDNPELTRDVPRQFHGNTFWLVFLTGVYLATFSLPFLQIEGGRRLVVILIMILFFRLAANISVAFVRFAVAKRTGQKEMTYTSLLENVTRGILYMIGILVIFQTLGIAVLPIVAALGVGGLAISLALQDTLANIFAGINMMMARQIKLGDFIKLDSGFEGTVEDIGWRNTIIRQINNNFVVVPNNKMASSIIINSSLSRTDMPDPEMSIVVQCSVSYDSDLEKVEQVTIEVATQVLKEEEGGVARWEPTVRYHTFGDSSIDFSVNLRVHTFVDQFLVQHRFIQRLHTRFKKEGIEIPYPQRSLHFNAHDLDDVLKNPTRADVDSETKTTAKKPAASTKKKGDKSS